MAHHITSFPRNCLRFVHKHYSLPLGSCWGLQNEPLSCVLLHVWNRTLPFFRKDKRHREKREIVRTSAGYSFDVDGHEVFSANLHWPWKVVHFLKLVHVVVHLIFHTCRRPHDCPLVLLLFWNFFKAIVLKCILNYCKLWMMELVVISSVWGHIWFAS